MVIPQHPSFAHPKTLYLPMQAILLFVIQERSGGICSRICRRRSRPHPENVISTEVTHSSIVCGAVEKTASLPKPYPSFKRGRPISRFWDASIVLYTTAFLHYLPNIPTPKLFFLKTLSKIECQAQKPPNFLIPIKIELSIWLCSILQHRVIRKKNSRSDR
jgi:hypothetical protein